MLIAHQNTAIGNDEALLLQAVLRGKKCLFIDAANCANPYKLLGVVDEFQLKNVFVMNAEAIYRFKDTLLAAQKWMRELGCSELYVSSIGGLFSYDDQKENEEIIRHCYYILADLAQYYSVHIALDTRYEKIIRECAHRVVSGDEHYGSYGFKSKASLRTNYPGHG